MKKFIVFTMLGLGAALMAAPSDANARGHGNNAHYNNGHGGKQWNNGHRGHWNNRGPRFRQPVVYYNPRPVYYAPRPVVYVPRHPAYYYPQTGLTINYRW